MASILTSPLRCCYSISPPRLSLLRPAPHFPSPRPHHAVTPRLLSSKPLRPLRAVEEETAAAEPEEVKEEEAPVPEEPPVSVPVSPSDVLTMFFKAEGTMSESAVPTVTNALQETEGVSDLKVQVLEGIASVEMTKQTTVQATGVASSLVEIIQGAGFKLQALNLSFDDEEYAAS